MQVRRFQSTTRLNEHALKQLPVKALGERLLSLFLARFLQLRSPEAVQPRRTKYVWLS
jgi:hypothetical protein